METKSKITIGVLLATTAIFAVIAFKSPSVVQVPTQIKLDLSELGKVLGASIKAPVVNVPTPVVNVTPKITVQSPERQTLGAVPSFNSLNSGYVNINGNEEFYYNQPMSATSSVPCSIQNPFNATSTVIVYGVKTSTNSFGASVVDISTSTTGFASSTPAFVKGFSTGAGQYTIAWTANGTTTNTNTIGMRAGATTGISDIILGPTEYINFRISTSSPGTFGTYNIGSCTGVIQKI
jgi:hypothetical protein